jgi:hypothetical protein
VNQAGKHSGIETGAPWHCSQGQARAAQTASKFSPAAGNHHLINTTTAKLARQ